MAAIMKTGKCFSILVTAFNNLHLLDQAAFLVCRSLHAGDWLKSENNTRDFIRGIGTIEKIRELIGEEMFALLISDFYAFLNKLLKAITEEELNQLETEVLKFLVGMAYWSHITLDLYEFKIAHIAEKLKTKKKEVAKAVKKLKRLRIIDACDSTADSTLEERIYKLCEQYAKLKNPPLTFFYR